MNIDFQLRKLFWRWIVVMVTTRNVNIARKEAAIVLEEEGAPKVSTIKGSF